VEKYSRTREAIDDNLAHVHFTLGTQVYKHTLRIFNSYCFSTATMVAPTHLNVTLYVQCLSCCTKFHPNRTINAEVKVKVIQFLNSPGEALWDPGGCGSQISR